VPQVIGGVVPGLVPRHGRGAGHHLGPGVLVLLDVKVMLSIGIIVAGVADT
jgi:hypothetical protein